MAKFTLTINDSDDGEVEVETAFSPPIKGPVASASLTPAQDLGVAIMMLAGRAFECVAEPPKKRAGKRGR